MSRIPVVLEINCGYARVAIRELTVAGNGTKRMWIGMQKGLLSTSESYQWVAR